MIKRSFFFLFSGLVLLLLSNLLFPKFPRSNLRLNQPAQAQAAWSWTDKWAMPGANPQRTSWNNEEVPGRLHVEWYHPIEPFIPYKIQPVAANGRIYISTSKGLYAFNAENGNTEWIYPTEMPLGNSPTIIDINNTVTAYVGGYDHKIHALDALAGTAIAGYIPYEAGAGFDTNPLVIQDQYTNNLPVILAGNRDGYFYALNAITGALVWRYQTQGPILFSAAYKNGTVYFASNDMFAYALNVQAGQLIWKSAKLPGAGFHSYWPVIYTEKATGVDYVIFGGGDNIRRSERRTEGETEAAYIMPECYTSPPTCVWGNLAYPVSTAPSDETYFIPGSQLMNATEAISYFETYPTRRSSFILNASTGQEFTFDANNNGVTDYAPFTLTNITQSGNRYPVVAGSDNILYGTNAYVDAPYIPRSDLVGWKFGTSLISRVTNYHAIDEPMAYSGGGSLVYWALCGDREAGTFDLSIPYGGANRSWGYIGYNLITQAPDYDPMYNDGNPAHYNDMNGWQVYSGKNQSKNGVYGKHGTSQSPPIPYQGKLYLLKGNTLFSWKMTTEAAIKLPLAEIVAENPAGSAAIPTTEDLTQKLENEIQKIIAAGHLRPGYHSSGMYDQLGVGRQPDEMEFGEIFDYFQNPSDTVYTLLLAYPHLTSATQQDVKNYLQSNYGPGQAYDFTRIAHVGWGTGGSREAFSIPPEDYAIFGGTCRSPLNPATTRNCNTASYWTTFPPFSFYAAWKYAQIVGDSNPDFALNINNLMSNKLDTPPTDDILTLRPYWLHWYLSGYFGYLELQKLAGLPENATVRNEYTRLLNLRMAIFNKDIPLAWQTGDGGTHAYNYNTALAIARNFMFLTPELGDYFNQHLQTQVQEALGEYTYLAPYWFVPKFDQTTGEGTLEHLYDTPSLFQAKAWILKQPRAELVKYLDVPAFERGDLFYIQNLVAAIEAPTDESPPSTPTPTPSVTGDLDGDDDVDIFDYSLLVQDFGITNNTSTPADLDGDDDVDIFDYNLLVQNFGI